MTLSKVEKKNKRAQRVRKKLKGSSERPRLSVNLSTSHIYAQIIDDDKGITVAAYGTQSKDAKFKSKSKDAAKFVGEQIAKLAQGKKIEKVVFDRGPYKYHGIIAMLANGARETGLKF